MRTGCTLLMLILTASLITSCKKAENDPLPENNQGTENAAAKEESTAASENSAAEGTVSEAAGKDNATDEKKTGGIDDIVGDWELAYTKGHSEYGTDDEPYDYVNMADDPYAATSELIISKKDGKFIADYNFNGYETDIRYLGVEFIKKDGPAYPECENKDWYFEFADPFSKEGTVKKYTLLDSGELVGISLHSEGEKGKEDYYYSLDTEVYLRKDSPEMKNREELRYFETVTVSSLDDLINNIDPNKKVILKKGTYDFTKLDKRRIDSDHIKHLLSQDEIEDGYRTYTLSDFSNFCIEAEEPGEVLICTEEAYDPVMFFRYANNLTLRGLVCGHEVEPGYCSGSVLGFSGSSGIKIDNCKLYGCGTYGLEIHDSEHFDVKDSEIYECTYGLLDIYSSSSLNFENCTFRDSKELSMICVDSGYEIVFDGCTFKNNRINPEYTSCHFVDLSEYSEVTFNSCCFDNNQYNLFSNRKVTTTNCTINDNQDSN